MKFKKEVWDKLIPLTRFYEGQRVRYLHSPEKDILYGIVKEVRLNDKNVDSNITRRNLIDSGPFYLIEWHKDKERKPWLLYYSESLLKEYY